MRSPRVRKLILENTGTDRIAAVVDSSPYRVRAWLKAREASREQTRQAHPAAARADRSAVG
jgi:hypothetical protein